MNSSMLPYAGLMLFGVLISSLSQVLLKKAAQKKYSSRVREYLNVRVVTAYAIFFLATLCTVFAYRVIPLSMGPVLESTSYVFVSVFGWLFFGERFGKKKIGALALIIGGIVVYSLF